MQVKTGLRAWAAYLHKRISKRKKSAPYQAGLPDAIDATVLNSVLSEYVGDTIESTRYQHLSGWKSAGAYRIAVRTKQGKDLSLIFKNAVYSESEIPALAGLPAHPGPPEFTIYSQFPGPMTGYLPVVYLAEEIIPGRHYQYVLEDLSSGYRRVHGDQDMLRCCALLPELHQCLAHWNAQAVGKHNLIHYGSDFSSGLQTYAQENLASYQKAVRTPLLQTILDAWPEISALHLSPEFFDHGSEVLIHGDANYTNIHLHLRDERRFKVVDWEWAGFAHPLADLASLLKGASGEIEEKGFERYIQSKATQQPDAAAETSMGQSRRLYRWCCLERGLLDASFLAAELLGSSKKTQFDLTRAVNHALQRVLTAFRQLSI